MYSWSNPGQARTSNTACCFQGETKTQVSSCCLCLGALGTEVNTHTWPRSQGPSRRLGRQSCRLSQGGQSAYQHACVQAAKCCFSSGPHISQDYPCGSLQQFIKRKLFLQLQCFCLSLVPLKFQSDYFYILLDTSWHTYQLPAARLVFQFPIDMFKKDAHFLIQKVH